RRLRARAARDRGGLGARAPRGRRPHRHRLRRGHPPLTPHLRPPAGLAWLHGASDLRQERRLRVPVLRGETREEGAHRGRARAGDRLAHRLRPRGAAPPPRGRHHLRRVLRAGPAEPERGAHHGRRVRRAGGGDRGSPHAEAALPRQARRRARARQGDGEGAARMTAPILFTVDDGLARITLNRPDRLNAFDAATGHAWADITAEAVARDDVAAVLLAGNGPAFCAGGDVRAMVELDSGEAMTELAEVINRGILALVESELPVAVAAHGTTVGGGLGILLAGDYAIVGEGSRIGSRYANMGLTPDLSVSAQLARAVGERRALQLVLSDRMLSGAEAVAWGLAAEQVPDAEVAARAEAVARSWVE